MRAFLPRFARHLDRKNGMMQDNVHMFFSNLRENFFHVK